MKDVTIRISGPDAIALRNLLQTSDTFPDVLEAINVATCPNCRAQEMGDCPRCFTATGQGCSHGAVCDECKAQEVTR